MTRATRKQAVVLLKGLRAIVAVNADAGLSTAWLHGSRISCRSYSVALEALEATRFYSLTRSRPAMVRAVDHALRLLASAARKTRR